jgi:hypothetical protein
MAGGYTTLIVAEAMSGRVPPLGRATAPPGSDVPIFCAFRPFPRSQLRARISPRAPSQSSMTAPPPHGPDVSQKSTVSIPRAAARSLLATFAVAKQTARALSSVLAVQTACGFSLSSQTPLRSRGSSAISSRSAVLRRGSYARHCTEIHPQLPRRLLSLQPHRQGIPPGIAARLWVHSFRSLTFQNRATSVPAPVPSTTEPTMPHFGPPCSRAPVLAQRVMRMKIAISRLPESQR